MLPRNPGISALDLVGISVCVGFRLRAILEKCNPRVTGQNLGCPKDCVPKVRPPSATTGTWTTGTWTTGTTACAGLSGWTATFWAVGSIAPTLRPPALREVLDRPDVLPHQLPLLRHL